MYVPQLFSFVVTDAAQMLLRRNSVPKYGYGSPPCAIHSNRFYLSSAALTGTWVHRRSIELLLSPDIWFGNTLEPLLLDFAWMLSSAGLYVSDSVLHAALSHRRVQALCRGRRIPRLLPRSMFRWITQRPGEKKT